MIREFPLWPIVLLPGIAALVVLMSAGRLSRWLGARSFGFAHYLGVGATAMSLLFVGQAISHLSNPADLRPLGDMVDADWLARIPLGSIGVETLLIGDRLAISAALLIGVGFALVRLFVGGPAGLRELELPELASGVDDGEVPLARLERALRRLALLGLLESAAMLVVLASDLVLAAVGWAMLGLGTVLASARTFDDERRASLATRVLAMAAIGDLALFALIVLLVAGGIGSSHTQLWLPATGPRLFGTELTGIPLTELLALALVTAVGARLASLTRLGNSLAESALDSAAVAVPGVYLLFRFHRLLANAPTVLALVSIVSGLVAIVGVAIALTRPGGSQARRSARPIGEQALAGLGLAWLGLIGLAVGVGAWRTAALLLLAHLFGRVGTRLALLTARPGARLNPVTGVIAGLLAWAVAGVAPSLAFVGLARLGVDLMARNSLLGPGFGIAAAVVVAAVVFAHAAAVGRLWFQREAEPVGPAAREEDGLDFASIAVSLIGLVGLGVLALGDLVHVSPGPTTWIEASLPEIGGHPNLPLGPLARFSDDGEQIARGWTVAGLALSGVLTGFGWLWARDRFRRRDGSADLGPLTNSVEYAFGWGRAVLSWLGLLFVGLAELAARGIGRGVYEEGPKIAHNLAADAGAGIDRLGSRGLIIGGARAGVLGLACGLVVVLGWLFFKPSVIAPVGEGPHGFGGLRPRLIKAGGSTSGTTSGPAQPAESRPTIAPPVQPEVRP